MLACQRDILVALGITDAKLVIGSLGDAVCRPTYREHLRAFLEGKREELCENCNRRLTVNPLRVLDCKEPGCRRATADAPLLLDHLCAPCAEHFARVRELLDRQGVAYEVDPRLVRGLDYYVRTTFEVTAPGLGAQAAVGAGGRYDGLVAQLGGPPLSGIGFAFGVDRLVLALLEAAPAIEEQLAAAAAPEVFVAPVGVAAEAEALGVARRLRSAGTRVELDGGRSLKSLMRRAGKLKVPRVLILGEEEIGARRATLRDMVSQRDEKLAVDLDLTGTELLDAVGVRR
jgi:histidyl-tRNA synthetase